MHFGTFAQADDGEFEPVELTERLLDQRGTDRPRFWIFQNGEGRNVPPIGARDGGE